MAYKGTKVKTAVSPLKYVFIKGEGRNNALLPTDEPRMQYVASVEVETDGEAYKQMKRQIDAEWKQYKEQFGVKGAPKSNGMKTIMIPDPTGAIDPETEEIAKIDSGKTLISFKTNTTWPDGKPQVVKVFDGKSNDITAAVHAADWAIGEGSMGVIHGQAVGNNVGGTHKVTLYLSAVQIAKLVKYEGDSIDTEDIGGEELDLDSDIPTAITTEEQTPNI